MGNDMGRSANRMAIGAMANATHFEKKELLRLQVGRWCGWCCTCVLYLFVQNSCRDRLARWTMSTSPCDSDPVKRRAAFALEGSGLSAYSLFRLVYCCGTAALLQLCVYPGCGILPKGPQIERFARVAPILWGELASTPPAAAVVGQTATVDTQDRQRVNKLQSHRALNHRSPLARAL